MLACSPGEHCSGSLKTWGFLCWHWSWLAVCFLTPCHFILLVFKMICMGYVIPEISFWLQESMLIIIITVLLLLLNAIIIYFGQSLWGGFIVKILNGLLFPCAWWGDLDNSGKVRSLTTFWGPSWGVEQIDILPWSSIRKIPSLNRPIIFRGLLPTGFFGRRCLLPVSFCLPTESHKLIRSRLPIPSVPEAVGKPAIQFKLGLHICHFWVL